MALKDDVINEIGNMTIIAFWTRNIEKKGFRINGFKSLSRLHYSNKSGKTILLEQKATI